MMEGASDQEPRQRFLAVEICYDGSFSPKPIVYFDPRRMLVTDVDFKGMGFDDLIRYLKKIVKDRVPAVYYCLPHRSLRDGLRGLNDDNDYVRFLDAACGNDGRINLYVDHHKEDVLDWIEEEKAEDMGTESDSCDDDVDSVISDALSVDHEEDDEEIPLKKSNDPFLSSLTAVPIGDFADESEVDVEVDLGDDNDGYTTLPQYPIHNPNQEWDKMAPVLGMKFCDRFELKHMLTNYAVAHGYKLYYEKNDSTRLLARCCKSEGKAACPFRLWATWMSSENSFQIKSLISEHNCCRAPNLGAMVTYRWIGKHLVNDILESPRMSFRKMKAAVLRKFNINVSVGQCRNAKKFALDEIEGSLVGHYEKVRSYGEELIRANPGSTVKVDVDIMPDSTVHFSRMYICLKGVRDGWVEGCRRVIGVDGCFLKGLCRGKLLSAVGRDANNQMYPIAWAVVAVENKETWKWFLDLLLDDIDMGDGRGLTLISDQHKGLVEAVKERVPECEHRQCARHIYANFKRKFTGVEYRKLFWTAAKSTTRQKFEATMKEIRLIDSQAHDHLVERDPKSWCRAFFNEDRCCEAVENGISEAFNAAIVEARKKPIITMLEEIRVYVMERMFKQKNKGLKWNLDICPSIRKRIENLKNAQRYWMVTPSGFKQFEVRQLHEVYAVDLNKRTCGCRSWQISGIPCLHGIAAISFLNENAEEYVAVWFKTSMFGSCYRYTVKPINGSEMWPTVECYPILPPKRRRLPGRPKVNRKKHPSEKEGKHTVNKRGGIFKCSVCNETGHNKRKCPTRGTNNPHVEEDQGNQDDAVEEDEQQFQFDIPYSMDAPGPVEDDQEFEVEPVQDEQEVEVEENEGGSSQELKRQRRPSERIAKLNLKRRVQTKDGSGETEANPVTLE